MPTELNRTAFQGLVDQDIAWLLAQPRSLERDHIHTILQGAADSIYGPLRADTYQPGQAVKVLKPQQGVIGPPYEWLDGVIARKTGRDHFACADYYKVTLSDGGALTQSENCIRPAHEK